MPKRLNFSMDIHYGFEPDAARAEQLDRRMYLALASSLEHLCEVSRGSVSFDEAGVLRLIESIRSDDRYEPMLFRDYYALADALFVDDDTNAADLFERLADYRPIARGMRIGALEDPAHSVKSAAYQQMMMQDTGADFAILPPSPEAGQQFIERFNRGMALMESALPELTGEVRALIREVVCVAGDPSTKVQFDGGSHFQLWGALFLNTDFHPTEHAIVEVVAHESAHSLLFAFCTDEPLVYNDDDELFPSPLRIDPRPMDGIYHATFVSARMHWAMSRLLQYHGLSEEHAERLYEARESDLKNFEAGYEVVEAHADLSDTGARLMQAAREYVNNATV